MVFESRTLGVLRIEIEHQALGLQCQDNAHRRRGRPVNDRQHGQIAQVGVDLAQIWQSPPPLRIL